jgi:hypothetical protein
LALALGNRVDPRNATIWRTRHPSEERPPHQRHAAKAAENRRQTESQFADHHEGFFNSIGQKQKSGS